jgi:L-lactate dehydrogenase
MNSKNRNIPELNKDGMLDYVQNSGGTIIKYKGATFYAVSSAVRHLCAMLLSSSDTITTVSSMMHGEYGIDDVCLSTLTLLGPNGVDGKIPMELTEVEIARLRGSAFKLKDVISNLKI